MTGTDAFLWYNVPPWGKYGLAVPNFGDDATSQNDTIRYLTDVVGRNLQPAPGRTTRVRLTGPKTFVLPAANDNDPGTAIERYAAAVDLPDTLPVGEYRVALSRDGVSWVALAGQTLTVRPDPPAAPRFPSFLPSPAFRCQYSNSGRLLVGSETANGNFYRTIMSLDATLPTGVH